VAVARRYSCPNGAQIQRAFANSTDTVLGHALAPWPRCRATPDCEDISRTALVRSGLQFGLHFTREKSQLFLKIEIFRTRPTPERPKPWQDHGLIAVSFGMAAAELVGLSYAWAARI
jgi:hypothetical protein